MKKTICILGFILASISLFANNNTPVQQFKEADKLYSENKFEEAAIKYQQIISEGFTSSELFFNTANTYYRLNEIGKAIYYYEKAKMLNPNDDDVNYNLELAKLRVKNLPPDVPKIFPVRIFIQTTFMKSYQFWGFLSLSLFVVFLLILFFYFTAKHSKTKKWYFILAFGLLFFSIIVFSLMQYQLYQLNAHNKAVIIRNEITAKSSPDDTAADLFKVYEGYTVKIENENGNWCEVKLSDGKKAWLKKEDLMIL